VYDRALQRQRCKNLQLSKQPRAFSHQKFSYAFDENIVVGAIVYRIQKQRLNSVFLMAHAVGVKPPPKWLTWNS
jgi:hypothetical protein